MNAAALGGFPAVRLGTIRVPVATSQSEATRPGHGEDPAVSTELERRRAGAAGVELVESLPVRTSQSRTSLG